MPASQIPAAAFAVTKRRKVARCTVRRTRQQKEKVDAPLPFLPSSRLLPLPTLLLQGSVSSLLDPLRAPNLFLPQAGLTHPPVDFLRELLVRLATLSPLLPIMPLLLLPPLLLPLPRHSYSLHPVLHAPHSFLLLPLHFLLCRRFSLPIHSDLVPPLPRYIWSTKIGCSGSNSALLKRTSDSPGNRLVGNVSGRIDSSAYLRSSLIGFRVVTVLVGLDLL